MFAAMLLVTQDWENEQCVQEMLEIECLINITIRDRGRHEIQQMGQMTSNMHIHYLALEVLSLYLVGDYWKRFVKLGTAW